MSWYNGIAYFQYDRSFPWLREALKISVRAEGRKVPYSFRNLDGISSGPPALFGCLVG